MTVEMDPDFIRTDGGTQPRSEINQEVINDYLQRMREGDCFPPVIVFFDGTDHWLADGFHRYHAAKQDIGRFVSAEVRKGTRRDAVLYSVGANATHGLRRTNYDKRRAVETLLRDEEWSKWSNREISRKCFVSLDLVNRIRKDPESSLNDSFSEQNDPYAPQIKNYITKHGTVATMNTSNIGNDNLLQRWREQERWHQDANTPEESPRLSEHDAQLSGYKGQGKWEEAWKWEHKANEQTERVHGLYPDRAYCPECEEWHREWEYPYGMKEGMWECKECGTEIHSSEVDIKEGYTEREKYETASEMGTLDYYYKDLRREAFARDEEERESKSRGVPAALLTSDTNEWFTPPQYVEMARKLMGTIDLDPASNPYANEKVVQATDFYDIQTNGLDKEWRGRVWLNPPYGRDEGGSNQEAWSRRLIEQYEAGITKEAILLVNANTEAKWFQPLYNYPICFTNHRIRFYNTEGTPSQPTQGNAFIYFGNNQEQFVELFSAFGVVIRRIDKGD